MTTQFKIVTLDTVTPRGEVPQTGVGSYLAPVTLDEASGNEVAFDIQHIVNKAAGNDTGLKVNQTDTVSGGISLLADFQTATVSQWNVDNAGKMTLTAPTVHSTTPTVSAGATQTQAGATALTEAWNNVATVATDGDGVALPVCVVGYAITVKNSGAASLAVYPADGATDQINAMADDLAINIPVGGEITFRGTVAGANGAWETKEVLTSTAPSTQKGEFVIKAVDNDADYVTTLSNAAMGQASVISIPDPGGATGTVMLLEGAQIVVGAQTFNGGITAGDVAGVAMATGEGSGWAGAAAVTSEIVAVGKKITTQIFVDIEGLLVSTTLNDVIGDTGAANSHGGQFLAAESGTVYTSGSITCLEAPTVADADIDFNVNSLGTLAESVDVGGSGTNIVLLANTEAWTLGMTKAMALLPDATSDYLYLSNGVGGGPGTFGAGKFVIELIGYEA